MAPRLRGFVRHEDNTRLYVVCALMAYRTTMTLIQATSTDDKQHAITTYMGTIRIQAQLNSTGEGSSGDKRIVASERWSGAWWLGGAAVHSLVRVCDVRDGL